MVLMMGCKKENGSHPFNWRTTNKNWLRGGCFGQAGPPHTRVEQQNLLFFHLFLRPFFRQETGSLIWDPKVISLIIVEGCPSCRVAQGPLKPFYATVFTHTWKYTLLRGGHEILLTDRNKILGGKKTTFSFEPWNCRGSDTRHNCNTACASRRVVTVNGVDITLHRTLAPVREPQVHLCS